jgi:endonuclease/exonuclease/phosphatase family metal-dependent hydrolase
MRFAAAILTALVALPAPGGDALPRRSTPDLLSFDELVTLSDIAKPEGDIAKRLETLLHTPFLDNEAHFAGAAPHRPSHPWLGPMVRAAMWNIERGNEFDLIRLAFSDSPAFVETVTRKKSFDSKTLEAVRTQSVLLAQTDLIILNEVDLGVSRTDYRDVARELAAALRMNYAFGVEFIEVDKLALGLEKLEGPNKEVEEQLQKDLAVDPKLYRGLHGNAVLSRYPIRRARIHRFRVCYDWFGKEKQAIAGLEAQRRRAAERVFLERIGREVRHGGRMALIAELEVPELPEGRLTVVAAHLENKCPPRCRREQMEELLRVVQEVDGPVVLGGDLNTTSTDAAPTSVRRELSKRVKNPKFWAGQAIKWFNPVSLPALVTMPTNYFRNYLDPTTAHVPFLAPSRESALFTLIERFRFADGYAFDFRGDAERTADGRTGTLANSNQRGAKGFQHTFALQRDYFGLVGRYKLDWIFVKAFARSPKDPAQSYRFAPHFGLTMQELNDSAADLISDHSPITVDLPLAEPGAR